MKRIIKLLLFLGVLTIPVVSIGQEIDWEGWPVPDLRGISPYSINIKLSDGVEKVVEKFYRADEGQIVRISGNGKVFAYVVDRDREPPLDYLLLDPDGS